MSYKQLQKQFARQKLLSTIISFTSVECAVYVIDATETIRRTVDDMLPFLCSSNKMLSCPFYDQRWATTHSQSLLHRHGTFQQVLCTFLYKVLHIPRTFLVTKYKRTADVRLPTPVRLLGTHFQLRSVYPKLSELTEDIFVRTNGTCSALETVLSDNALYTFTLLTYLLTYSFGLLHH